ncbi:VOC family protein [Vibrio diabolicus]|uniref:VOC family protein n=1 Tax=Vibrio diabolicus TaxID=50719 RepID=UPI0037507FFE
MNSYVEHANITVVDPAHSIDLLLSAIPEWEVRGKGVIDDWFGKKVNWYHIGDNDSYITIQSGGEDVIGDWKGHWSGVKHIGIVVPNILELVERLSLSGFELDHWGGEHPFRKSVYYLDKNNAQFEFIEYLSDRKSEQNDYEL